MEPHSVTSVAVVVPQLGGPEVLIVRQCEIPVPGPGEVRVRQEAAGISYADLLVMQGVHPERAKAPFVPGWDVLGVVDAIGTGVAGLSVGDRVAGLAVHGGWAEYAVVPASRIVPVGVDLKATKAVCLVMDYIVALQMLTRKAQVTSGDTILVQGVGGGVGTAIMQLARTMDIRVLGSDREGKRQHVESQGATLIDFEHQDVVACCRDLTNGQGVDAAFDGVGRTARSSLKAVRKGGRLVWFGMVTFLSIGGDRDIRRILQTAANVGPVFAPNLIPGGKRTSLYSIQLLARKHPGWYRHDLTTLMDLLAAGDIDPQIAAEWKLDEVPAAVNALAHGAMPGKQVIVFA